MITGPTEHQEFRIRRGGQLLLQSRLSGAVAIDVGNFSAGREKAEAFSPGGNDSRQK